MDWKQGNQSQIFEVIKLSAVLIDALAASYLIYFTGFGLSKLIFTHGHDEHRHEHVGINDHQEEEHSHDKQEPIDDEEAKLLPSSVGNSEPYVLNPPTLGGKNTRNGS